MCSVLSRIFVWGGGGGGEDVKNDSGWKLQA